MKNEEAIKIINNMPNYKPWEVEALALAIKALEQQPKMQDCEHCIHTYGTLGCCDMVNNEWVYDCEFGKEQYKKEHESQPCEDCISREALMKLFKEYQPSLATRVCEFGDALEGLPSVTPKTEWIPVTEKLPEKSGKYLVTVKNGNVYAGTYDAFSGKFQCAATAWQLLPEPYRHEENLK